MPRLIIILLMLFSATELYSGIEDGLVVHWSFDKDYGVRIVDESGNGIHGQAVNVSYEQGAVGHAVVFNSRFDRIYIPDSASTPPTQISNLRAGSISLWFKYKNVGGNIPPVLYFGENDSSKKHNSLIIEIGHNGSDPGNRRLYFTIINQRFCFDSGFNLNENQWYHFVAVVSENGNTGYLNGQEMTRRHYNLGSDSTYSDFFADVPVRKLLSIGYGRYGQEAKFFTYRGSIDDIRIYDRPLTAAEVKTLWQMGDTNTSNQPDYENVAYGPDERNVLDFWKAESDEPTPVVFFIHGGGFRTGDKTQLRAGRNADYLRRFLEAGVSVAAINYRFRMTTRLDTIILDCARAVQFVRSKATEWNIDKTRFGSFGGSAGGGATIWLGYHDDIADPYNPDPVLRESSKLQVCGHLTSQATYDFAKWYLYLDIDSTWMDDMRVNDDLELYHIPDRSYYDKPEIIALRQYLDMTGHLDRNDPPTFLQCLNSPEKPTNSGAVIHHPGHPVYIKHLLDSLGIDNVIHLRDTPPNEIPDMVDFFLKYLKRPTAVDDITTNDLTIPIYPNPATDYIEIKNVIPAAAGFDRTAKLISRVNVYDVLGNIVLTQICHSCGSRNLSEQGEIPHQVRNDNSIRIDVSGLAPGVYFVRVGGRMYKFVKM